MKLTSVVLFFCAVLAAQTPTGVRANNLVGVPITGGSIFAVLADGSVKQVDLDSSLVLDISGPRPKLVVVFPAPPPAIVEKFKPFPVTVDAQSAFVLDEVPATGSVVVIHNGLEYTEAIDYTLSADRKTITILSAASRVRNGDLVKIRYRL